MDVRLIVFYLNDNLVILLCLDKEKTKMPLNTISKNIILRGIKLFYCAKKLKRLIYPNQSENDL
jgi:hypothetical protein